MCFISAISVEGEVQGSGLAGFVAHLLWKLYPHFPMKGSWDWLLLFLLLAVVSQLSFVQYLWRCVESDMKTLRDRKPAAESMPNQGIMPGLVWAGGWMYFFVWFFQTPEGQTFLIHRTVQGGAALTDNNGHHQVFGGLAVLGLIMLLALTQEFYGRKAKVTVPFRDRGFWSLWQGGGTFAGKDDAGDGVTYFLGLPILLTHILYWYWSDSSLTLMYCFLLAALMADALRMSFVYVLHKRYFG
jgi:hypothetical protein